MLGINNNSVTIGQYSNYRNFHFNWNEIHSVENRHGGEFKIVQTHYYLRWRY